MEDIMFVLKSPEHRRDGLRYVRDLTERVWGAQLDTQHTQLELCRAFARAAIEGC
jgi:hypothetical protein